MMHYNRMLFFFSYIFYLNMILGYNVLLISGFATEGQLLFQTAGSFQMEDLISLHHYILLYLIIIFVFVCVMTYFCYADFRLVNHYFLTNLKFTKMYTAGLRNIDYETVKLNHNSLLEFIWTLIPSIILLVIAVPSFLLLYSVEESINPDYIVKVIAHQWYWVYEIVKK